MKRLVPLALAIMLLLAGCSKTPSIKDPSVGFDQFTWFTTFDTVKSTCGAPIGETPERLRYSGRSYNGSSCDIDYFFPDGMLTCGTYRVNVDYQGKTDEDSIIAANRAAFEKTTQPLIEQYGAEKVYSSDGTIVIQWIIGDIHLTVLVLDESKQSPILVEYLYKQ